jgi:hypothetical protein
MGTASSIHDYQRPTSRSSPKIRSLTHQLLELTKVLDDADLVGANALQAAASHLGRHDGGGWLVLGSLNGFSTTLRVENGGTAGLKTQLRSTLTGAAEDRL